MTELELLQAQYADNQAMIAELTAENIRIKDRIRELAEEEILEDNEFWGPQNDLGGREFKLATALKNELMAGSREERMYAQGTKEFNTLYVVPLANDLSDVPEDLIELYSREQAEHFATGVIGGVKAKGYLLDDINLDEGGELEGYAMPWCGNPGPVVARQNLEAWWSQPNIRDIVENAAAYFTRILDWRYRRAVLFGTVDEFMEEYPYYETP